MRIRPFFWMLLAAVCASVLIFATISSVYKAIPMYAHIDQVSSAADGSAGSTLVRLHLADPEGVPIDQARVIPNASMEAMPMGSQQTRVEQLGQGVYLVRLHFSMVGTWNIDITARADGFAPVHQFIQLAVL